MPSATSESESIVFCSSSFETSEGSVGVEVSAGAFEQLHIPMLRRSSIEASLLPANMSFPFAAVNGRRKYARPRIG